MWTPVLPDQLAGLSAGELATSTAPDRWHGPLQALGTHCRDGAWVVSGAHAVSAALASPALCVPALTEADGPAADLLARMARFSDGPDHRRRRDLVTRMLPRVSDVARSAGARANDYLLRRAAAFDIMPMARMLPAEVLARALGLPPANAARAAILTGLLCDAVTPALQPRPAEAGAADAAAAELCALLATLRRLGSPGRPASSVRLGRPARPGRSGEPGMLASQDERVAAAASILFQARDATAALIGTAILARSAAGQERRSPSQRVEHILRHEAPVQCTRRTATSDVHIGSAIIPEGAAVWVFVATAERGAAMPATFGTGPHGCPGAAHATAIARQVVAVVDAEGWRPVPGQRTDFEPRPNIRIPGRVLVARP
jgi:cytochrome P450